VNHHLSHLAAPQSPFVSILISDIDHAFGCSSSKAIVPITNRYLMRVSGQHIV
jgi:hypothetical protein